MLRARSPSRTTAAGTLPRFIHRGYFAAWHSTCTRGMAGITQSPGIVFGGESHRGGRTAAPLPRSSCLSECHRVFVARTQRNCRSRAAVLSCCLLGRFSSRLRACCALRRFRVGRRSALFQRFAHASKAPPILLPSLLRRRRAAAAPAPLILHHVCAELCFASITPARNRKQPGNSHVFTVRHQCAGCPATKC